MAEFLEYEVLLGTFEGEDFIWKTIYKSYDFDKAYKFYYKYTNKQMSYTDEELKKIWSSGRVDIELKQGKKLLNWVGIYSRKVSNPDEVIEESEKDDKDKDDKKDKDKDKEKK